jgi:hypothetical protein
MSGFGPGYPWKWRGITLSNLHRVALTTPQPSQENFDFGNLLDDRPEGGEKVEKSSLYSSRN